MRNFGRELINDFVLANSCVDFCFFRNVEDADDVNENKSGFNCRSGR
ncbi:hypothetical protein LEP1GSC062_0692 [Leptospira alexanderi serovar Manhao 3 str. L 60]|uniref:Uncharacterized protein n=1 Tax=Leptospira alexanderi serovar Manhao 3 str. L 60 TaxID=1049759 RepID=V6I1H3_9LEPT|nr:hypothetical protein LEP1GSC062_0692 [Leptospira alexanderi serovar Manhao 3 str. L 60]